MPDTQIRCRKNNDGRAVARMSAALVPVMIMLATSDAEAYIDPGTGSLLYQTALALLVGAGFYFRHAWRHAARAIARIFKSTPSSTPGDDLNNTHA